MATELKSKRLAMSMFYSPDLHQSQSYFQHGRSNNQFWLWGDLPFWSCGWPMRLGIGLKLGNDHRVSRKLRFQTGFRCIQTHKRPMAFSLHIWEPMIRKSATFLQDLSRRSSRESNLQLEPPRYIMIYANMNLDTALHHSRACFFHL